MATGQWKVKPLLDTPQSGIWVGPGASKAQEGVWLGSLAELVNGKTPGVWVAAGKEQVIGLFGKRGSGKSFTLGVLVEGFGVQTEPQSIARGPRRKAVVLFDPLDIYWTTRFPVAANENSEARGHFELAKAAKVDGLEFNVAAWVPGERNLRKTDPNWFRALSIGVSDLGLDEWSELLDTSVVSDPLGQALSEVIRLAGKIGYTTVDGVTVAAKASYGIVDLLGAVRSSDAENMFHPETLRALAQRLAALDGTGLFATDGTNVREIVQSGKISVILLGRLPSAYRAVVVSVLTRRLIEVRAEVAFAEKRLVVDPSLSEEEKANLRETVNGGIPKTVVALDEAQTFLAPGAGSSARDVFVRLVKEGRNFGLSAIVATQQPSAVDRKILSQVETFVAHQLVTSGDIEAVVANSKTAIPESVEFGKDQLSFSDMLRMLGPGQCVVSAADMNTTLRRSIVVNVRPRATVHGGIEL